ncbi:hypothetical protein, partial [Paenibacillus sp. AR247]|uniref:hypothetical protein n=1 Tax=Paenibacillus sp. AR247 TaxID=1631599 RepID=UPI000D3FE392
ESFKVLIKELQSLGMDVKILSGDEQEIEMKELDDEDEAAGDKLSLNLEGEEVGVDKDRVKAGGDTVRPHSRFKSLGLG